MPKVRTNCFFINQLQLLYWLPISTPSGHSSTLSPISARELLQQYRRKYSNRVKRNKPGAISYPDAYDVHNEAMLVTDRRTPTVVASRAKGDDAESPREPVGPQACTNSKIVPDLARLSRNEIESLRAQIRPVMRYSEGQRFSTVFHPDAGTLHYVDTSKIDPVNESYAYLAKGPGLLAHDLVPILEITTFHSCGHPQIIVPSESEVLAQIPETLLGRVTAYEVKTWLGEKRDIVEEQGRTYHWLTTTLYGPKSVTASL